MIKKISIRDYKAFHDVQTIALKGSQQNILLYGENGSGKTSFFEALRFVFFYNRLHAEVTASATDLVAEQQAKDTWLRSQENTRSNGGFTISLNDIEYTTFPVDDYEVFMISTSDVRMKDSISLKEMLHKQFLTGYNTVEQEFLQELGDSIVSEINKELKEEFLEDISIRLDGSDDYRIIIKDEKRPNIESSVRLSIIFNEAKLTLINTLLLLKCAMLLGNQNSLVDPSRKKYRILVIDDIVSSLDIANRSLLVKYIIEHFRKEQLIMLTHNVAFYNYIQYFVNEHSNGGSTWYKGGFYVYGIEHKIRDHRNHNIATIKAAFNFNQEDPNIGNDLRKLFEELLYDVVKILQVGPFLESQKLINDILTHKDAYFVPKSVCSERNIYGLIKEIRDIANYSPKEKTKTLLQKKLSEYDASNQFKGMLDVIDNIKLYQKLSLHQASHGHEGLMFDSTKEKIAAIQLLEKLEQFVKENDGTNVYSM